METFRRLRSRRRSKGQADSFTSFADAESNYHRSASSPRQLETTFATTTTPTRSSATASRPSDIEKKLSPDQLRQSTSPSGPARPSPAHASRIQPLLIGIPRPTTASRPVTAGSFQNAVDRAADAVNIPPRATQSPSSQLGLRAGRYIDIFAISGQSTKPAATFNEDVAERNLDTIALTIEEQHYTYVPTSKYQEEVAVRNVLPRAAHRSPLERNMSNLSHSREPLNSSMSPRPDPYARHTPYELESATSRHVQKLANNHSRQDSSRVRDGPDYLPVIQQEWSSDDHERAQSRSRDRVQEAELDMERAKARWLGVRRHNMISPSADTDKPLPASPRPKEHVYERSSPLRSHPVDHVSDFPESHISREPESTKPRLYYSESSDVQQLRKYGQDNVQSNVYRPDRRSANTAITNSSEESRIRSDVSIGPNDRRSYASDASRRTQPRRPSDVSNNSYRRVVVGNRTIMDLTAEDDTEDASVASYMQTPVIENAREDAFQKVVPTVVNHQSPSQKTFHEDPVVPNSRWSSALEPILDLDQLARRSQIISETAKAAAAARSQAKALENQRAATPPLPSLAFSPIQTMTGSSPPQKIITFSAIETLTAITPRSSQEVLVVEEPQPPVEQAPITRLPSKDLLPTPHVDGRTEKQHARISANIAPVVKVFADVRPEETKAKAVVEKPGIIRTSSGNQKNCSDQGETSKRNERRREKMERVEAIREAAKKKIPAGPLDHEPLPGVKTRDFALLPVEKPTNKRIEALSERKRSQPDLKKASSSSSKSSGSDKKHRSKSSRSINKVTFDEASVMSPNLQPEKKNGKKSSKPTSSTNRKARPISSFDEVAFQKKHAEANAALLRLQQSLQENLDDDSSQLETPRDANTPVSRTFSSAGSAYGKSPIPESPSAAAIAMITTVTSSPRNQRRPKLNSRMSSEGSQSTLRPAGVSESESGEGLPSRKTAAPLRSNATTLTPISTDANIPPPSPGEVSLSSFPIPTPRTMSPESNKSPPAYVKDVDGPVRRGSQGSRVSTASTFNIPFTMVPNRLGSLPENRAGVPGPPNPHQMQSINAVIPPVNSISSL